MAAEIEAAERTRAPIDRGWTLSFIATLFAIHIGRMSTDLTLLGMLSPPWPSPATCSSRVLITLLVINPVISLAGADALDRAAVVALASRTTDARGAWIDRAIESVASLAADDGDPDARSCATRCPRR